MPGMRVVTWQHSDDACASGGLRRAAAPVPGWPQTNGIYQASYETWENGPGGRASWVWARTFVKGGSMSFRTVSQLGFGVLVCCSIAACAGTSGENDGQ